MIDEKLLLYFIKTEAGNLKNNLLLFIKNAQVV